MIGMIGKLAVVLLLSTTSVVAQIATRAEPRIDSQVMDFWVTNTEQLLPSAAEAMPEKKYSFALSNGKFSGVRTFAEQVKDLALPITSLPPPRWARSRLLAPISKQRLTA